MKTKRILRRWLFYCVGDVTSSFSTSPTVYQKNILITTTTTSSKLFALTLIGISIRVASYQTMDKGDYFTLSRTGCTHFVTNDEMEFVSLEQFEFEHKMFKAMLKVCRLFRVGKGCFSSPILSNLFTLTQ